MFSKAFWLATGERVVRGAIAALAGVYLTGNLVFDTTDVSGSLQHIASIAVGGAFSALLLSLGIQGAKRNGPALTGSEVLKADQ